MTSSILHDRRIGRYGRQLGVALAVAALITGMSVAPAMADNNDRGGYRSDHNQHGSHWNNSRHGHRGWHGDYYPDQPVYRRPYVYAEPVYVPPPVYYAPRQSPGISLFFPFDQRR